MPRLSQGLLHKAWNINPYLPLLLRTCRNLVSAQNELAWIKQHIDTQARCSKNPVTSAVVAQQLHKMCIRRARGEPLQYILRSQPFGDLDILCRPGVLIPRMETEAYTASLAQVILGDQVLKRQSGLRILDLCTGTGAIALGLYHQMSAVNHFPSIHVLGLDISARALRLAKKNLQHNSALLPRSAHNDIAFQKSDILDATFMLDGSYDVVVSNPPYISSAAYWKDTARSARIFEPKLALVPANTVESRYLKPEDVFYQAVIDTAWRVGARVVLMEVGDMLQARRVLAHFAYGVNTYNETLAGRLLRRRAWDQVEIWRDWPEDTDVSSQKTFDEVYPDDHAVMPSNLRIRGSGHGRSVFLRLQR